MFRIYYININLISLIMQNKIDSVEKVREIGNSLYVNIRKDIAVLLDLNKNDYVKISIEKIIKSKKKK